MQPRVFILDKPVGMTSYDVIRQLKQTVPYLKSRKAKVGHLGTLDPFASGLLLVAVGGASKLNDYIHRYFSKTYLAEGIIGIGSASGDPTHPISVVEEDLSLLERLSATPLPTLQEKLQQNFVNTEYLQTPPAYSACKHQGKPLYEWAREGVTISKNAVPRTIYMLNLLEISALSCGQISPYLQADASTLNKISNIRPVRLLIRTCVSSGTYIRTLFEDIAKSLGTVGVLLNLRREAIGHLHLGMTRDITLEQYSPNEIFPLPNIVVNSKQIYRFLNGNSIPVENKNREGAADNEDNEKVYPLHGPERPQGLYWVMTAGGGGSVSRSSGGAAELGLARLEQNNYKPLIIWNF
ncbi:MAG: hypothetical protein HQK53_04790 [Oligoflexia bacterium]|nr:hypothetical protein [Oligoflexia bacterium]